MNNKSIAVRPAWTVQQLDELDYTAKLRHWMRPDAWEPGGHRLYLKNPEVNRSSIIMKEGHIESRSPFFVNGREVPRVCFDQIDEAGQYSAKYGGFIRFKSAHLVTKVLDELAGSYVEPNEVVVLTPYRAQVALIRSMIRRSHPEVSVSTVHRAQGSERTLVVFDPVDASSRFFAGREGDRLVNVAISRAKAHVVIPFHQNDLEMPALKKIHDLATKLWQTAGQYSKPFSFQ